MVPVTTGAAARRRVCAVWNWKAALVSATMRAPVFFTVNLPAGFDAAAAACLTEFLYRICSAGFYGALTTYFARRRAQRAATLQAIVVLPALAHSVEYVVHRVAGTPFIATAIGVSIVISMTTTRFSLAMMRRGLFVAGGQSLAADLRELVLLIVGAVRREHAHPGGVAARRSMSQVAEEFSSLEFRPPPSNFRLGSLRYSAGSRPHSKGTPADGRIPRWTVTRCSSSCVEIGRPSRRRRLAPGTDSRRVARPTC
ncbi:MAG: hypothetical protein ABS36_16495 [Acidobacteria bacterium SCN 69-37]|mgnify:CR=1 FL=1|nr:MAG: hypothetical protein ABS36_16495 [Acidobacteria bacterium SCN 69-37]